MTSPLLTRHRARVATRLTSLLDEAGFARQDAVLFDEDRSAYVVTIAGSTEPLYLGPDDVSALRWARRLRWDAQDPQRDRAHRKALDAAAAAGGLIRDVGTGVLGMLLGGMKR